MDFSEVIAKRRDRALAIILGFKERECDSILPQDVRNKLRKIILDQINDYHEFVMDLLNSTDSNTVIFNDAYYERLSEIETKLDNIQEALDGG